MESGGGEGGWGRVSAPLVSGLFVLVLLRVTSLLVSFKFIHRRHKSESFL